MINNVVKFINKILTHSCMKVFITGGSGFIGYHLVNHLLEQGHKVKVVDLKKPELPLKRTFCSRCGLIQGETVNKCAASDFLMGTPNMLYIGKKKPTVKIPIPEPEAGRAIPSPSAYFQACMDINGCQG